MKNVNFMPLKIWTFSDRQKLPIYQQSLPEIDQQANLFLAFATISHNHYCIFIFFYTKLTMTKVDCIENCSPFCHFTLSPAARAKGDYSLSYLWHVGGDNRTQKVWVISLSSITNHPAHLPRHWLPSFLALLMIALKTEPRLRPPFCSPPGYLKAVTACLVKSWKSNKNKKRRAFSLCLTTFKVSR